jgi:hypothetical protein
MKIMNQINRNLKVITKEFIYKRTTNNIYVYTYNIYSYHTDDMQVKGLARVDMVTSIIWLVKSA